MSNKLQALIPDVTYIVMLEEDVGKEEVDNLVSELGKHFGFILFFFLMGVFRERGSQD